jgi:flagellar protein FliS
MYGSREGAYRDVEVLSASPERVVLLLYEKLLVSLRRGAHCIRARDIRGKHESLTRAGDIACELLSSLDYERGGDLAHRLASLYTFWGKEISEGGRALDPVRIDRVQGMVAELHESWKVAVEAVERGEVEVPGGVA